LQLKVRAAVFGLASAEAAQVLKCTCFTSTKVQILTLRAGWQLHLTALRILLALLVQKYKY
jgi:hypothetical protein